ncbi:vegetative incompatibility het-e-1 [Fusarium sporotrichioides]|uniref:Vegetative incompatibility het-e-1 n=1 Tax=Fusarium sporotrichioides TaxID=5514 RepID=A0A395SGX5_FUSSP|nr:vegetative incompatibility het-e-1 [Fusarium sporotrichioides]
MADPLPISASIVGLVALADLIFRFGTKYIKSYKGAKQEVENPMREVKDLSVVLHNLELAPFDPEQTEAMDQNIPREQNSSLKLYHIYDSARKPVCYSSQERRHGDDYGRSSEGACKKIAPRKDP